VAASIDQTAPKQTTGSGTTRTATFGANPQIGSKVCVYVWVFNTSPAPTSVTDNASTPNTYTQDKTATGNSMACFIYRSDITHLPNSGTLAVTVTFGSNRAFTAGARSYLGLAAGGPTGTNSAASSGAQTTAGTGAAGGASTGLQFAVLADGQASGTATITAGNSFTEVGEETNASSFLAGECADRLNAASSQACSWTITNAASLGIIAAYDVASGTTVEGSGVGAFGGLGVSTGTPRSVGSGAAAFGGLGVSTGLPRSVGAAEGLWGFTGTATGEAGTPPVEGAGAGDFGGLGTATGVPRSVGAAVADFGGLGAATGQPVVQGSGAGLFGGLGSSTGVARPVGSAAAAFGGLGTATGTARVVGSGVGDFGGLGTAQGTTAGTVLGAGAGAFGGLGAATGVATVLGAGSGSWGFLGQSTGQPFLEGAASGLWGGLGAAQGVRRVVGAAVGSWGFLGAAEVPPDAIPGHGTAYVGAPGGIAYVDQTKGKVAVG
jgi:hypothetical protein